MHTIIRDASISKNDFVFYADRINRLVVEAGLGLLPFSEKTVITPTGHAYVGVDFARKLCGVSIIRSGEGCYVILLYRYVLMLVLARTASAGAGAACLLCI
jgi:uracil phosphoribosyltransferase